MNMENKKPIIYIISGKAGHGKNTVGDILKQQYNLLNKKVITINFSFYLKVYTKNILNWDGKESSKPREFLQKLGVELIKEQIDSKMLIRRVIEDIKVYSYFYDVIIVTDARFKEEIEDLKKIYNDTIVIRVVRNIRLLSKQESSHLTETALDDYHNYDYVINNNQNIDKLKQEILKILKSKENNNE